MLDINTNFLGVYKWNTYKGELDHEAYYLNWNYGEPNDKFYEPLSGDCPGEDCIQIRKFSGNVTWHDLSCETRIPYICEKIRGNLLNLPFLLPLAIVERIESDREKIENSNDLFSRKRR